MPVLFTGRAESVIVFFYLLARVGLEEKVDSYPRQLSGGQGGFRCDFKSGETGKNDVNRYT